MEKLPKPIINLIVNYLDTKERSCFGRTCNKYKIYAPGINGLLNYYKKIKKLINLANDCEYFGPCRICFAAAEIRDYCGACDQYTCGNCLENDICEYCEEKTKCTDCKAKAFGACLMCESIKCIDHLEYFEMGSLLCKKCEN